MMNEQNMLEVRNLTKHFKVGSKQIVHAVDGVSFTLKKGKTLGLVGESGCGKSTCARTIIRMYAPTSGQILLNGEDITELKQKQLKPYRKNMQMIFQDPYASLNARMTVRDIIAEPLIAHGVVRKKEDANELIYPMLERVGLTKEHSGRYAHDLSMVRYVSDDVGVMYLGQLVEVSESNEIYKNPLHPYTKGLLGSIPIANPKLARMKEKSGMEGDIPSPIDPPSGCRFHTRCPYAKDICSQQVPQLKDAGNGHMTACHLYG